MLNLWMPCNKDLRNQGLVYTEPNGPYSIVDDGPYGKCIKTSTAGTIDTKLQWEDWDIVGADVGFGGWLKFNRDDIRSNSAGTYTTAYTTFQICVMGASHYGSYGLHLVSNNVYTAGAINSVSIIGTYRKDNSLANANGVNVEFDKWHHYYTQFKSSEGKIEFYYDGVFISSGTNANLTTREYQRNFFINYPAVYSGNAVSKNIPFWVADVRLHNRLLTPGEIMEMYKCKVFGLNENSYYPSVSNLMIQTGNGGLIPESYPWDSSKHVGAIYPTNGWASGYNSGVGDPTNGYHACWKMIDGIPTMVFQDMNSTIGQTHRWLGISNGSIPRVKEQLTPNAKYTISMEARADVDGKQISTGVYYKRTSSESNNFYDGCSTKTITKEWKRYYWHYTAASTIYALAGIYVYGHYGTEGTSYVRNIQFELGHAESDFSYTDRGNTMFDGHGTSKVLESANITKSGNTIYLGGSSGIDFEGLKVSGGTLSMWINTTVTGTQFMFADSVSHMGLTVYTSTSTTSGIIPWIGPQPGRKRFYSTLMNWGQWNQVTTVFDANCEPQKCYINGQEAAQYGTDYWSGTNTNASIGKRPNNSSYYNGYIGNTWVFRKQFTADEVVELYNKERGNYGV